MIDAISFKSLKEALINELYETDTKPFIAERFNHNFFILIEKVILSLMEDENNFFALFTIQMKREIRMDMETAVASKPEGTHFILFFNPWIFLTCSLKEMQALLKHEVYHILNLHHLRAGELSRKYSALAINLAMDISINQYIINLPVWSENLESVKLSYNVDLKEEMTMEQYAHLIQAALNKLSQDKKSRSAPSGSETEPMNSEKTSSISHNIEEAHNVWYTSDINMDKEQLKETTRKMSDNAAKGKLPESIAALIGSLNKKPEISWSEYLKKHMGTLPSGHKKTITRKDRRQPERLDLRGRLSTHTAEIVIAIDISGSVTDKEIEDIMTEILSIVKNYPHTLTIIESDSEIRRVYEVKNLKDVKQKLNTKGSTKFSPVFRYLKDASKRNCMLIYFTDGLGEAELDFAPYHHKTLWVLTGKEEKLSLSKPYGTVKRLKFLKPKADTILALDYLKLELKDKQSEWAK